MPVLIDREQMCVRYRHVNENVIWNLMAIEFTHTSVIAMNENMVESYDRFTDYELKMLYLNLCGQKYTGYARDILVTQVKGLVQSLPQSEVNGFELSIQVTQIREGEENYYRYVKGSNVVEKRTEPYVPAALTSVAGYVPAPVAPQPASAAPAHATQAASTSAAPRSPTSITLPAEAPKAGSKTGRVWEIAETEYKKELEHREKFGGAFDAKALRKSIIFNCEAEGINGSTASVQYGKWKTTKSF
jgi:hypothetical protein